MPSHIDRRASVEAKIRTNFEVGDVVEHVRSGKSYLVLLVAQDKCLLKQEGLKSTPKWISTSNVKLGQSLP
jgi:hypothetical protein